VLDLQGGMQGMLTRRDLISALAENGPDHPVIEVMQPCPEHTGPGVDLTQALDALGAINCPALPVLDPLSGELVGLLTAENIGETLMVRAALLKTRTAA
jgi:stage IV sporulation protein FB